MNNTACLLHRWVAKIDKQVSVLDCEIRACWVSLLSIWLSKELWYYVGEGEKQHSSNLYFEKGGKLIFIFFFSFFFSHLWLLLRHHTCYRKQIFPVSQRSQSFCCVCGRASGQIHSLFFLVFLLKSFICFSDLSDLKQFSASWLQLLFNDSSFHVIILCRIPVTYIFQQRWISYCSFLAYIFNSQRGMILQSEMTVGNFSLLLILSCFYFFLKISATDLVYSPLRTQHNLVILISCWFTSFLTAQLHVHCAQVVSCAGILCRYCRVGTLTV